MRILKTFHTFSHFFIEFQQISMILLHCEANAKKPGGLSHWAFSVAFNFFGERSGRMPSIYLWSVGLSSSEWWGGGGQLIRKGGE